MPRLVEKAEDARRRAVRPARGGKRSPFPVEAIAPVLVDLVAKATASLLDRSATLETETAALRDRVLALEATAPTTQSPDSDHVPG